jgi:hypothetical protein
VSDPKGEDAYYGSHSPSNYLSLNQEDNDNDIEDHETYDDAEDPPADVVDVENTRVRCGCSPNKIPSNHCVIT